MDTIGKGINAIKGLRNGKIYALFQAMSEQIFDLREKLTLSEANSNLWKISYDLTKEELVSTVKERDALIDYMQNSTYLFCDICRHNTDGSGANGCERVRKIRKCFEWVGLPEGEKNEFEHE